MAEWKDVTSYSAGKRGQVEPRSWDLKLGHMTICVHRHIDYPGEWMLTCYDVHIERRPLLSSAIEQAREEAIKVVRTRLMDMATDLDMRCV